MSSSRKRRKHSGGAQPAATTAADTAPVRSPHPGAGAFYNSEFSADQDAESRIVGRSQVPSKDLAALSKTSYSVSQLFQPILNQRRQPVANKLLEHVLKGEKDQAEAMVARSPMLLRIVATAKDHAGRTIKATPLQAALGAKDVSIGKHEEMVEMIMRHMRNSLDDGQDEIERQKAAQFPEGWEQEDAARKAADTAALNQVFVAIGASTTDDQCEAAVAVFQVHLAQQKERVIETGYHFNEQLFEEALVLYDNNYTHFGGFDSPKNRAAAIKVIGGIECLFPANLAQAACDGFGKVVNEKAPLSRSLLLSHPNNYPFFRPGLGESYFVYSYYAGHGEGRAGSVRDGGYTFWWLGVSTLMSSKSSKLGEIMRPQRLVRQSTPPWCVVQ